MTGLIQSESDPVTRSGNRCSGHTLLKQTRPKQARSGFWL